jgi:hypothetical protein
MWLKEYVPQNRGCRKRKMRYLDESSAIQKLSRSGVMGSLGRAPSSRTIDVLIGNVRTPG